MKRVSHSIFLTAALALTACVFFGCVRQQAGRGEGIPSASPTEGLAPADSKTPASQPVVNVYLENSGSMYGYVDRNQKSMFQQSVYNYLVDVQSSGIPSSFNLHFINNQIIPKGNDVNAFINGITANDFRNTRGDGTHTDIAEMLKMILDNTSNDTVSIFISDCILSPGRVNQPEAYLTGQMVSIKKCLSAFIDKAPNTMVMVYQVNSPFNGKYYDYEDNPRQYEGNRPYYIIVIGSTPNLYNLKLHTKSENFIPRVNNYWGIFNYPVDKYSPMNYALMMAPKKGSFNRKNPKTMSNVRTDADGQFQFTIAADMTIYQHLLEDNYLYEVDNYARLVNKTDSKEFTMSVSANQIATSPMTLDYQITTNQRLSDGVFSLVLLRDTPEWAETMTDLDDRNFDNGNEMKTYGLRYIFDGIKQAYSAKIGDTYTSIDITVTK